MGAAWIAVIVSGVTVVVNFFGVMRAGVVQTRIAHDQRIGDRRIDAYLELLKWADTAEDELREARGALDTWETVKLPQQLALHIRAFGSDEVNKQVYDFQAAWIKLKSATQKREDDIKKAFAEGVRTGDYSGVWKVVPEYEAAKSASQHVRQAVRDELKPRTARTLRHPLRADPPPQPLTDRGRP